MSLLSFSVDAGTAQIESIKVNKRTVCNTCQHKCGASNQRNGARECVQGAEPSLSAISPSISQGGG